MESLDIPLILADHRGRAEPPVQKQALHYHIHIYLCCAFLRWGGDQLNRTPASVGSENTFSLRLLEALNYIDKQH